MSDYLGWTLLHQNCLNLGKMNPTKETVYCPRKKSFVTKNNLYKMNFALHYSWTVCRDPLFQ